MNSLPSLHSLTLLLSLPFPRPLSLLNPLSHTFVALVLLLLAYDSHSEGGEQLSPVVWLAWHWGAGCEGPDPPEDHVKGDQPGLRGSRDLPHPGGSCIWKSAWNV